MGASNLAVLRKRRQRGRIRHGAAPSFVDNQFAATETKMPRSSESTYRLTVRLDASGVKDRERDRAVKLVAYRAGGREAVEARIAFNQAGEGRAAITFDEAPGQLRVVVGPENATTEQMRGLQTIAVDVPSRRWAGAHELELSPIVISPYYWRWWWRWCQTYKISGRVVCADGSPVAGATVCAYDVDAWWWWWSKDQVGCATTDANGAFEIDFTRCCGWWPWWWWENRAWLLEPSLAQRIGALLRDDPRFRRLPTPSPRPSLAVFNQLLSESAAGMRRRSQTPAGAPKRAAVTRGVDPSSLEALRKELVAALPASAEFERFCLWPWCPWQPWWDCDADIIFQVTQTCGGQTATIVNETIAQTRWNIPTTLNVTLVANDQACCVANCATVGCPEGNCFLPSDICLDNVGSIGGNLGAPPVVLPNPTNFIGLLDPGQGAVLNYGADRPYAGSASLEGSFGDLAKVDYYELLYYDAGLATPSTPLPPPPAVIPYAPLTAPGAYGGFNRQVFVSPNWVTVPFPVTSISDGTTDHLVIETIAHYEANHGPQLWDAASFGLVALLNTLNTLPNGTYFLQIRGWKRPGYAGNLASPQILPACGTDGTDNWYAITIDNQTVSAAPTDPNGLHCGPGTVHLCTGQPETAILNVAILHQDGTTTPIGPCGNVCVVSTDQLVVDFAAFDPDGYLAYYTMAVDYGASLTIDLLSAPGASLSPSPIPPPWCAAAAQVGPDYGAALTQGASAPWWTGGAVRLTVPATEAFPETCAYLLQVYAHKRTITGCDHSFWNQYNLSEQSFTIVNPCPALEVAAAAAP